MATKVDLPLAQVKAALKIAYDQAARAEKANEAKFGLDSPITKGYTDIRLKLNNALITATEIK